MTLTANVSMTPEQIEAACRQWMASAGYTVSKEKRPKIPWNSELLDIHQIVSKLIFAVEVAPVPPAKPPTKPAPKRRRGVGGGT